MTYISAVCRVTWVYITKMILTVCMCFAAFLVVMWGTLGGSVMFAVFGDYTFIADAWDMAMSIFDAAGQMWEPDND